MKNKAWIAAALYSVFVCSYALDPSTNSAIGAKTYDWETCVNLKSDPCIDACSKSEDTSCPDTCKSLARDKCISEGLRPPQGGTSLN